MRTHRNRACSKKGTGRKAAGVVGCIGHLGQEGWHTLQWSGKGSLKQARYRLEGDQWVQHIQWVQATLNFRRRSKEKDQEEETQLTISTQVLRYRWPRFYAFDQTSTKAEEGAQAHWAAIEASWLSQENLRKEVAIPTHIGFKSYAHY